MPHEKKNLYYLVLGCAFYSCQYPRSLPESYESNSLKIEQLTQGVYMYTSFLQTNQYGRVPCNGLVVVDEREALIFDTPINDSVSHELINWVEKDLGSKIKTVVVTHFHVDCLGGLPVFHKKNIPSYASNITIQLAKEFELAIPQKGIDTSKELSVGSKKVITRYFGEGHTRDNIVGYIPSKEVLFGGCLVKSVGAGKGFLGHASLGQWSNTVAKVKEKYPNLKIVIPGHGKPGGMELLDFTIDLFKPRD